MIKCGEYVDIVMLLVVLMPLLLLKRNCRARAIQHNSVLTGAAYFSELIDGHDASFHDTSRMDKQTFTKVTSLLVQKGKLKASRGYCYLQKKHVEICAGQKILIFIFILTGHTQRDTSHRWQHSLSTISSIIHDVAESILSSHDDFIITPRPDDVIHSSILNEINILSRLYISSIIHDVADSILSLSHADPSA